MMENAKTLLAAASIASLGFLSGCAAWDGGASPADETADFAPVDYNQVCLLDNPAVKSPKLADALEEGFRRSGATVKRLPAGTPPGSCPFVITYEAVSDKGVIKAISFQTFEHGIPRVQADGKAQKDRGLTVGLAAAYAQEILERLKMQQKIDQGKVRREAPAQGARP